MNHSRRLIYGILITLALGGALGRLMSTQLLYEPSLYKDENNPADKLTRIWPKTRPAQSPTFSSNDRSRWATMRALVDEGTYVVGQRSIEKTLASAVASFGNLDPLQTAGVAQAGYYARIKSDTGIITQDGYGSVDKVLHPDKMEFYSSKPPLLSTLLAGLYWLLQYLSGLFNDGHGWTLAGNPNAVVRTILLLVNVLPFILYLQQIARLAEAFGRTDWGKLFVVAAAAFGTVVTPFLITLNNHTIATYCVLFALVSVVEIWKRTPRARGGCADQEASSPWQYHLAAGFFAAFAVCNELPALAFASAIFLLLLFWSPRQTLLFFLLPVALLAGAFFYTNYAAVGQLKPAYDEFGSPWYEYEGSHWRKPPPGFTKAGIDWAHYHESRGMYVFNLLIGHHGLFSLTPLWLLSIFPMVNGLLFLRRNCRNAQQSDPDNDAARLPWFVAPLTLILTVTVVGFYILKSDNYGGFTNGLRWLMWLTPLWILCLLPAADWLSTSRWGRGLGYLCLAISVLSANYSPWNPWRHPWLYDLSTALGWWDGY
jgi:hypothetical protein